MHNTNHESTFLVPVVHIADPAPADYDQLIAELEPTETELRFYTTANAAISHARQEGRFGSGKLWLVNSQLPDMRGADLVEILRGIFGQAVLVIVDDQYDKQQEIAAVTAGATIYVYKPISAALITSVCGSLRSVPQVPVPAGEFPGDATLTPALEPASDGILLKNTQNLLRNH
jgi:DNA-binding response OmpR family regulator